MRKLFTGEYFIQVILLAGILRTLLEIRNILLAPKEFSIYNTVENIPPDTRIIDDLLSGLPILNPRSPRNPTPGLMIRQRKPQMTEAPVQR